MILTSDNIKEKSISELVYFLTYPETFNKGNSLPVDLIYDCVNRRLANLKFFDKKKFDQFLLNDKYLCKVRGKDLKNYIFKCSLTINEILNLVIKEQQRYGTDQFYFFTFSEMVILIQVYETLYMVHKELLAIYEKEYKTYKLDSSRLSKYVSRISDELNHSIYMENKLFNEWYKEKQLTFYYLNCLNKLKGKLYEKLGMNSLENFDILEFNLLEYMKAQSIINSETRFIKSTRIGLIEEIKKLKELTTRDLLDNPQLVRKYSINKY